MCLHSVYLHAHVVVYCTFVSLELLFVCSTNEICRVCMQDASYTLTGHILVTLGITARNVAILCTVYAAELYICFEFTCTCQKEHILLGDSSRQSYSATICWRRAGSENCIKVVHVHRAAE